MSAHPRSRAFTSLVAGALALGTSGCFFVDSDPAPVAVVEPTAPAGTLTVRWTIHGLPDPNDCVRFAAANIEVRVLDRNGFEIGAWQQRCTLFATSIPLAPGTYSADALLLDAAGQPRTTIVPIRPFTVFGNDVIDIPIDFPIDSFY